ncbi:MAG TPA: hypothetical protein PLK14_05015 [Sediminibacterium sp.]|nr:hypothetical protein [Sediminibacterium sp.]HQS54442.1 hypothetical protein [Sediminibacterium sp.]
MNRFAPQIKLIHVPISEAGLHLSCVIFCLLALFACNNQPSAEAELKSDKEDTISSNISPEPVTAVVDSVYAIDSNKTYIYLTFDDGPQHGTVNCINICQQLSSNTVGQP